MSLRRIHVLPEHLANQIAAGEVIQRPESVVKELLENALDAGATAVTVVIKDGGKRFIQVVDDGIGMDEQDAVASFLRHATSKIESYEDLEGIRTYGFRGEALASIAAVAQVTMKTRRREDDAAAVVQIDGGGKPRVSREGREPGTSIVVQNLFFNVPARRKFLKSGNTEFRHIYDVVQRVAISHPDLALTFVSDDDTILDLKPSSLDERLTDVFGERLVSGLLPVEEHAEPLAVTGYVGKPSFGQKTRAHQYLFLNKRYIVSRNINHAVYSSYEHLLTKGTFPFFLLFMDIDPHHVDVNVHPAKLEAKFDDEQGVYRFISALVRKALGSGEYVPAASVTEVSVGTARLRFTEMQHMWGNRQEGGIVDRRTGEILPRPVDVAGDATTGGQLPLTPSDGDGMQIAARLLRPPDRGQETAPQQPSEMEATRISQLDAKYVIVHSRGGLTVIDQHVAHERVLYERVLKRFEEGRAASQQLLFPVTVLLTAGEYALFEDLRSYFDGLGFVIQPFGGSTVIIEAVPVDVGTGMEEKIVRDLLSAFREYQQHSPIEVRDDMAKMFACKAAIKAGDRLSEPEMRSLIEQLFATNMPYVCPHGRPIVLKIPVEELDRRFGRT